MVKGVLEGRVLCDRWGWYIMEQIKSVQILECITVCTIEKYYRIASFSLWCLINTFIMIKFNIIFDL